MTTTSRTLLIVLLLGGSTTPAPAQAATREDSLLIAQALRRVILPDSVTPKAGIMLDTTTTGWNGLVAAVIRRERPEVVRLRGSADSTVTPLVSVWGAPSSGEILVSISRCTPGRPLMYGSSLSYLPTREGGQWKVTRTPDATTFHGVCGPL